MQPSALSKFLESGINRKPFDLELLTIEIHYGDRCTKRSGVPFINHIYEGLLIMEARLASRESMAAYCLHPIFQDDLALDAFMNGEPISTFRATSHTAL